MIALAAICTASLVATGVAAGGAAAAAAAAAPPAADPVSQQLLARLASAAHGIPVPAVRQLAHHTAAGPWTLGSASADGHFCFMLGVPGTTLESTCATRAQLLDRQLLVYAGAKPAHSGRGWDGYAVYGVVSPKVRSLTVMLSDCTKLPVRLSTRPLFWAFVPGAKLARHVIPTGFAGRIGPRVVRGPLLPLGAPARGRCAVPDHTP